MFGLLAIALGFIDPVAAANISAIPGANGGPAIILIRGEPAAGDDNAFASVALVHSSAVVLFDSNGGLLLPGLGIGNPVCRPLRHVELLDDVVDAATAPSGAQ